MWSLYTCVPHENGHFFTINGPTSGKHLICSLLSYTFGWRYIHFELWLVQKKLIRLIISLLPINGPKKTIKPETKQPKCVLSAQHYRVTHKWHKKTIKSDADVPKSIPIAQYYGVTHLGEVTFSFKIVIFEHKWA